MGSVVSSYIPSNMSMYDLKLAQDRGNVLQNAIQLFTFTDAILHVKNGKNPSLLIDFFQLTCIPLYINRDLCQGTKHYQPLPSIHYVTLDDDIR